MKLKHSHFPLSRAYLCCDCREVGEHASACACCDSRSLLGLAGIIDREQGQPLQESCEYEVERVLWAMERGIKS
jgi:hypothetical protein